MCHDRDGGRRGLSISPGELAAVASGLLGLAAMGIRVWGRVALVRHQQRAMSVAITASKVTGAVIRAEQRVGEDRWFVEIDTPLLSEGDRRGDCCVTTKARKSGDARGT